MGTLSTEDLLMIAGGHGLTGQDTITLSSVNVSATPSPSPSPC